MSVERQELARAVLEVLKAAQKPMTVMQIKGRLKTVFLGAEVYPSQVNSILYGDLLSQRLVCHNSAFRWMHIENLGKHSLQQDCNLPFKNEPTKSAFPRKHSQPISNRRRKRRQHRRSWKRRATFADYKSLRLQEDASPPDKPMTENDERLRALLVWAAWLDAERESAQAKVDSEGGQAMVPVLCDLNGNEVNAKLINRRFGTCWALVDSDGTLTGRFLPFKPKATDALRRRGYQEVLLIKPAMAIMVRGPGNTWPRVEIVNACQARE